MRMKNVHELKVELGVPSYRLRRVIDRMDPPVPRQGQSRMVPEGRMPELVSELRRRGWLPEEEDVTA